VKLVAVSGREQPVVLKVRRDGLWLYTEHGKVRCWAAAEPYVGEAVLHLQQRTALGGKSWFAADAP
jgi:hypothetical protein